MVQYPKSALSNIRSKLQQWKDWVRGCLVIDWVVAEYTCIRLRPYTLYLHTLCPWG